MIIPTPKVLVLHLAKFGPPTPEAWGQKVDWRTLSDNSTSRHELFPAKSIFVLGIYFTVLSLIPAIVNPKG
jgi:hypothetical protein